MDPERWQRLQALFDAAVEMTEDDRRAFLEQECPDDLSLRWQVESLILALDEASQLLDTAVGDTALHAAHATVNRQRFGPYQLERELGRGGMGVVFLARRADEAYEGQVAIKVLLELRGAEPLRRFQTERQILANLQHPNIARLLDAGSTDSGAPYVVIEYVPGGSITRYCDERTLTIAERIDLFIKVCRAVQYAHQNLVVHRDLKPDNILVTPDGTPKLLDFGIAKLLEERPEGDSDTATGVLMMTPLYASPEQVRGEPVTVATDVYGLGLVLYVLLTGRVPYDLSGKSLTEKANIITKVEPMRPSVAVGGAASTTLPDRMSTPAARLANQLTGDLDTILLTALQKDPARRYNSAGALGDDLERHRLGLPVKSRPDTFGYRWTKFIRRHWIATAAAAAALLFLTTFGIVMAVQANRIARERDAARAARVEAQEVSNLLVDLFEVADPSQPSGANITAREVLDRGAGKIAAELSNQPATQASMMEVVGRVYRNLGLYDDAGKMLEGSLAIRRRIFPDDHATIAASLNELGVLRYLLGKYEEAEQLQRDALRIHRGQPKPDPRKLAANLDSLGTVVVDRGRYEEAAALYREALSIERGLHQGDHQDVATELINLGGALRRSARFDEAEPLFREGLAMQRRLLGNENVHVAHSLNQLARLFVLKGDPTQAEPYAREGLAIRRRLWGDVHVEVAASLGSLAGILSAQGAHKESIATRKESLEILRKLFGEEHPYVAGTLSSLGYAEFKGGDLQAAEAHLRASVALHRRLLKPDHVRLASPLTGLASVLMASDRHAEAEPLLREAVTVRRAKLPAEHWSIAEAETDLGRCLVSLGRVDEAEPLLVRADKTLRAEFGPDDERAERAREALEALRRQRPKAE